MDCIFCDVANGKRKDHINGLPIIPLHQNGDVFSMLSIYKFHGTFDILVFPKRHFEFVDEVPKDLLSEVVHLVASFSKALREKYGGCNVIQNNGKVASQTVPHVHFHVIPRTGKDKVNLIVRNIDSEKEGMGKDEMVEKSELVKKLIRIGLE